MRKSPSCSAARLGSAGLFLLLAIIIGAGAEAAGVSVRDAWAEDGSVSLESGDYELQFTRDDGRVRLYDRTRAQQAEVMSLSVLGPGGPPAAVSSCEATEGQQEARCDVTFAGEDGPIRATFSLSDAGDITVRPVENAERLSVSAEFAYGVLPSRHLDDTIYTAADHGQLNRLHLPSEHLFVGLLEGGNRVLACAWPSTDQRVSLVLAGQEEDRRIDSLELSLAGEEAHLSTFTAPGIWHAILLDESYEEQEIALEWSPPFDATWKIQLEELGVPTTFQLHPQRRRPWRPTVGFYTYPFFREGGEIVLRLHKKLTSEGTGLIYALYGHEQTPYPLLTRALATTKQREITELHPAVHYYALDPEPIEGGRMMDGHCYGRDQLKLTTLAVGAQTREADFLETHILERQHECGVIATYLVGRALDRMSALSAEIEGRLRDDDGNRALASFLRGLLETVTAMEQEYRERLDGREPEDIIRHVADVVRSFRQVIREEADLELSPETLYYINELNAIIALAEDQGRRFGTWARKLFQQAAYECVGDPDAAAFASVIREAMREHMRYREYEMPRTSGWPDGLVAEGMTP